MCQPGRRTGRVLGGTLLAWCVLWFPPTTFSARQPEAPEKTPQEVVKQLCRMDADGTRLTPKGWHEASELFLHPQPFPAALVIRIAGGNCANMAAERVGADVRVGVDYLILGRLDSSMQFIWAADPYSGPEKWRYIYTLVATPTHGESSPGREPLPKNEGPVEWRIKDFQTEPVVSLPAATAYVTSILKSTADPTVRKNAQATLATLRHIHVP